jgi:hypothetical protein
MDFILNLMHKLSTRKYHQFFLLTLLTGCSSNPLLNVVTAEEEPQLAKPAATESGQTTVGLYEINSFDVYRDKDTIHVLTAGKIAKDNKIVSLRYLHWANSGQTWSSPVNLGDNLPATIAVRGNDVQIAAHGKHLAALWQTQGELPGMGSLSTVYSGDNGNTWISGANPAANNAGDQSHADLIADLNGNFHSVWLEDPEENGYQSLRYARSENHGLNWRKPETLDDSTCSCCWNTFALSSKNTLNILYRDMKPRDMALLQSSDGGKKWQRLGLVGAFGWQFDGCPHNGGALTYAGADSTRLQSLVWTGLDAKAGLYHLRSDDNGLNWSTPKKMGNTAVHADIAALDTNHVAAIWDEMEADGAGIFYASSEDGGLTWLPPKRLTHPGAAATHPRLVAVDHGYLALWTENPSKQPAYLIWKILK